MAGKSECAASYQMTVKGALIALVKIQSGDKKQTVSLRAYSEPIQQKDV